MADLKKKIARVFIFCVEGQEYSYPLDLSVPITGSDPKIVSMLTQSRANHTVPSCFDLICMNMEFIREE